MAACTLPFYRLSPGGNPTILVRDESLLLPTFPHEKRAAIARTLMDADTLGAEQVGFLDASKPLPHMEMMGGEFCINATRSAALVFALLGLLPETSPGCHEGMMTTSGTANPIRVRVFPPPAGSSLPHGTEREAAIAVPLAADAQIALIQKCAPGEALVRLPGITHLLLDGTRHPLPKSLLTAAESKRAEYGLDAEEAAGVIWYCAESREQISITPVVHVRATDSSVAETACGSGSLALALLLAQSGMTAFSFCQPSGHTISITLEPSDSSENGLTAWVSGIVRLTALGTAYI